MHVAHGGHRVLVHHRGRERRLEGHVGSGRAVVAGRGAGGHALGARPAGQGDEGHVAAPGRDGLRGVGHVDHVGGAAGLGGVDVAQAEAHVVGHGEAAQPGRVARAEVAVHVVLGEPGVGERAAGHLRVELGQRDPVRLAGGMLEGADDAGLVPDAHDRSLALTPSRRRAPPG